MNYFELFGLPVAPSVDTSIIPRKYFELQKKYHPDYHGDASMEEQEEMMLRSADVNKAFRIFSDKDKTLEYFLKVTGFIEENEKYELQPAFLMEMLELNDSLTERPAEESREEIEELEKALFEEVKHIILDYSNIAAPTNGKDILKLKDYYYKRKYLHRILERLTD